jgi:hypothetical protein
MEVAALNSWRGKLAELLIPPPVRESVLGDLHERAVCDDDYVYEILRIAPYVVASQMWRNLNLPLLLLQGGLALYLLGDFGALLLPLFLLNDAYQPATRSHHRTALREAVLISFSSPLLYFVVPWVTGKAPVGPTYAPGFVLMVGPLSLLLCSLRTSLILMNDHLARSAAVSSSKRQSAQTTNRKRPHHAQHHDRWEAVLLALTGLGLAVLHHGDVPILMLTTLYFAAAVHILTHQIFVPPSPQPGDPITLQGQYCRALMQRHQLRRFLSCLWLIPLLLMLKKAAQHGALETIEATVATVLLCSLAAAVNRESGGRVGEETDRVTRLYKKQSAMA